MDSFSSNIDYLEKYTNPETFFLSGWNKEPTIMNMSTPLIADAACCFKDKQNSYYFMSENYEVKKRFFDDIISTNIMNVSANNISIAPNGTSALFLAILSIKHKYDISGVILISPIYFSIINVIQMFSLNLHYYQADIFSNDIIDFDELKKVIKNNDIGLLIITDPLFGTGIPIDESNYKSIIKMASEFGIWVMVDYTYGGMEWERPVTFINRFLVETIVNYPKILFVESISKRLFINGIKFAIMYANSDIINTIEDMSESFIGSFSYVQDELFRRIYEPANASFVIKQIEKNIDHIKQTFASVKSVLLGKNQFISNCASGYFALMRIPLQRLNGLSGNDAAIAMINKVNIFTIPHSRYLFMSKDDYYFRINLSADRSLLLLNINKLSDTYLY